jgi:hypothetical protein
VNFHVVGFRFSCVHEQAGSQISRIRWILSDARLVGGTPWMKDRR